MFSTLNPTEPVIMVHRGWQEQDGPTGEDNYMARRDPQLDTRSRRNTEPTSANPGMTQTFEFVNMGTTTARKKDPGVRKLVRAHVVKDWSRRKKLQRLQLEKSKGRRLEPSKDPSPGTTHPQVSGAIQEYRRSQSSDQIDPMVIGTPLSSPKSANSTDADINPFEALEAVHVPLPSPQEMAEQAAQYKMFRRLLRHQIEPDSEVAPILYHVRAMGVAMFPQGLEFGFNPVCPDGCVGWHLNDESVYHGILYTTTTYAGLIAGVPESKEAISHVAKVVGLVNKKLKEINESRNGDAIDEGIIGAVASICLSEALKGNFDGWKLHMSGLKHLAGLNGGLSRLSTNLRFKLYRADLNGSIGFLTAPFFTSSEAPSHLFPHSESYETPWCPPSPVNSNLRRLIMPLPISQDLINIIFSMSDLSITISDYLSTRKDDKPQQAKLLDQTYSIQYALLRPWSKRPPKVLHRMEEALRVAGLLYMHATWWDFPFSSTGYKKLVTRLRQLVMTVEVENEGQEALVVWMLFMGAICADKDNNSRIWFTAHLQVLTGELKLDNWETVEEKLKGVLLIEKVHGKPCRKVWDDVMVLNSVQNGEFLD